MGQFSLPTAVTATFPNMEPGPWVLVPALASEVTVLWSNGEHITGDNAVMFSRLYWSTSPTGSSPTLIGAQTATFDPATMPKRFTFSRAGVPDGVYVSAFLGSNTTGNTNRATCTYFSDLPGAYDQALIESGDAACCHDPMLDLILAAVRRTYSSF